MDNDKDFDDWMKLATVSQPVVYVDVQTIGVSSFLPLQCFRLWDLDARGFHKVCEKMIAFCCLDIC